MTDSFTNTSLIFKYDFLQTELSGTESFLGLALGIFHIKTKYNVEIILDCSNLMGFW